MRKKTIIVGIAAALVILSFLITAYAEVSSFTMTYYPGTTDTVTNLPDPDEITEGDPYDVSPKIPEREGFTFLYWILDYAKTNIKVSYAVNPDPIYGMPDDSVVPIDSTSYTTREMVTVADDLASNQDYGINNKTGEKRPGRWVFVSWDRSDFEIYDDTTITGEWKFISKYKYSVHHLDIDTFYPLADDEVYWLDELGQVEHKSKKPKTEFYTTYQNSKYNPVSPEIYEIKRKNFLLPGAVYTKNKNQYIMTVTLTEDDLHIFFFYQRPSAG